jgi:hypothetical protein
MTALLAGADSVEMAMPDTAGALRERDTLDLALAMCIEQAQVRALGIGSKQREIVPLSCRVAPCGNGVPVETRIRLLLMMSSYIES